ncbi:humanin-like 3 [Piliocolobus tephrosceles]|uniref:Uncharacterized protein n=2 Tax=Cercopithecidae TaxID=9527 RepID=A0A0D9SBM3_CHLSB|nr:Humanin-like 3 [Macaca mulatta]XP_010363414.1 humanin-like 3 [Rhinopithecus roxellana]XP_011721075.1 humanin-like 3 [Macaca nemestrina]XP_011792078.1 PREDICTED: humanin-like 3 [Colobus angolensis palliatus]XP_011914319.1 PREDICTED: humanin-like 3 [Cercocebus atys]XP_017707587.1 PREDICTED: humanin-like 3 [Rhinopithecus bieti]XP_023087690.1 humanin-like 3 [Piliocolobus tephrosceles]XP_033042714.1 humanin-like 3 [Trachypithecus francoisi]XP_037838549.1 humanin-like 3 [Chlorocebus sabaeus]
MATREFSCLLLSTSELDLSVKRRI